MIESTGGCWRARRDDGEHRGGQCEHKCCPAVSQFEQESVLFPSTSPSVQEPIAKCIVGHGQEHIQHNRRKSSRIATARPVTGLAPDTLPHKLTLQPDLEAVHASHHCCCHLRVHLRYSACTTRDVRGSPARAGTPFRNVYTSARRRTGPSLGEHQQQSLPPPRRPLLRDHQAGQLHDRGCGEGSWRSS